MHVLNIRDENGNFIPIPAIRGGDGKSAYEQAKEGGYSGTEEEFIAILNGLTNHKDLPHYSDFGNPHKVTKSQVGLDKVPNVSTNDQTPTYTDTSNLQTLSSGEQLNVAFQKIKCAITNLINHIGNKSNPHGVTKTQLGLGEFASDINKNVVAGNGASCSSTAINNVVIGHNATLPGAEAPGNVVIGPFAKSNSKNMGGCDISIGYLSCTDGESSLAIGNQAKAGKGAIQLGPG